MSDASELERLRAKYGGSGGRDIHDPAFRRVAADQFQGERRALPYAGLATFMGLPHLAEGVAAAELATLDIAVLGVPMDLGVTNRAGCRLGLRAVRQYDATTNTAPAGAQMLFTIFGLMALAATERRSALAA